MKKLGILNSEISSVLSSLGHADIICIADCGLPISNEVKKIDLALKKGVPSFLDVLKEVKNDMYIEKIILATEIKDKNKELLEKILKLFPNIEVEYLSHENFKQNLVKTKAIIRTGEATAYANIILKSGVCF